mmetsp:Transcript_13462/g.29508  ORF Transcript_13462/g.29508 Transcript_13462/m.29508 type:complete len:389 (+) Transcript_13462:78-1244(+)
MSCTGSWLPGASFPSLRRASSAPSRARRRPVPGRQWRGLAALLAAAACAVAAGLASADSLAYAVPPARDDASDAIARSGLGRREASAAALQVAALLAAAEAPGLAHAELVVRTQKKVPEIPKLLAVMLLRTTYESIKDWGAYSSMAQYQRSFWMQLRDGRKSFMERYQNYDLSGMYNSTELAETRSGGVNNRFYFTFLNDAQWRVIGTRVTREADRTRFSRVVGDRLYRAILNGLELKADVPEGEELTPDTNIGTWPKLSGGVPSGSSPADLAEGSRRLLEYLKAQSYLKDFTVSDFQSVGDGRLRFVSFVGEPVNLEATASLMRSNGNFAPRYDQRILQAYFGDHGFECDFVDGLADDATAFSKNPPRLPRGVRTEWTLRPDPDAGL